jgi:hypothetical protein
VPRAAAAFGRIIRDIAKLGANDEALISLLVGVEEWSA